MACPPATLASMPLTAEITWLRHGLVAPVALHVFPTFLKPLLHFAQMVAPCFEHDLPVAAVPPKHLQALTGALHFPRDSFHGRGKARQETHLEDSEELGPTRGWVAGSGMDLRS